KETIACLKAHSGIAVFANMDDLVEKVNEFTAEHLEIQCGDTMTISFTPATCAGTAHIITVDGSGADAPGTQMPTLFIGVYFIPDAFGRNVRPVSLRLLPCEVLELAEQRQSIVPEPVRFKIAGIITKYKGKNYLLLQKAIRVYSHQNFDR
ncbi:unnamed protein product, partial [marine sediment metagenome]